MATQILFSLLVILLHAFIHEMIYQYSKQQRINSNQPGKQSQKTGEKNYNDEFERKIWFGNMVVDAIAKHRQMTTKNHQWMRTVKHIVVVNIEHPSTKHSQIHQIVLLQQLLLTSIFCISFDVMNCLCIRHGACIIHVHTQSSKQPYCHVVLNFWNGYSFTSYLSYCTNGFS